MRTPTYYGTSGPYTYNVEWPTGTSCHCYSCYEATGITAPTCVPDPCNVRVGALLYRKGSSRSGKECWCKGIPFLHIPNPQHERVARCLAALHIAPLSHYRWRPVILPIHEAALQRCHSLPEEVSRFVYLLCSR